MKKYKNSGIICAGFCILAAALSVACSKQENNKQEDETIKWCIAGMNLEGFDNEEAITEEMETQLNDILSENKKSYKIKFEIIPNETGKFSEEQKRTIQESDIITTENQIVFDEVKPAEIYPTLIEFLESDFFLPLDDLLETEGGEKIKDKMMTEITLESGKWDGELKLLPTKPNPLFGSGIWVEKSLYEKMGWKETDKVPDFTKCDEVFQKIYETLGQTPFLTMGDEEITRGVNGNIYTIPKFLSEIQNNYGVYYENDAGIGAVVSSETDLDTNNLIAEEYMEDVLNAWNRYIEKGYVNTDSSIQPLVQMSGNTIEVEEQEINGKIYIPVRPQEYVLHVDKQEAVLLDYFTGISAKTKKEEKTFEVLTDLITDDKIRESLKEASLDQVLELVFDTGFDEEEETVYKEEIETALIFERAHYLNKIDTPEVAAVREVFLEYCQNSDQATANPLMRYFSENGQVTPESIKKGLNEWNRKLEDAGMSEVLKQIKELKEEGVTVK